MWDKEFVCTFTVELGADQLKTNMLVKNIGENESFDFQAALHSYFTVSSLDKLEISGSFEGKEFLNKLAGDGGEMQKEERTTLTIGEEYDRVYMGVNDPVLKDAGTGKAVRFPLNSCKLLPCLTFDKLTLSVSQLNVVNEAGWVDTVIWNPYGNEGMGYNNFVCVESVKVISSSHSRA
jgi:glucose-6-phosphate 1-epimerase